MQLFPGHKGVLRSSTHGRRHRLGAWNSTRQHSKPNMLNMQDHPTTLRDVPAEVLAKCIPWDDPCPAYNIRSFKAVNRQMLEVLLRMVNPYQLGLRLRLHEPCDVPSGKATMKRLSKAFPSLHKLCIGSQSTPGMDCLASLLEGPQGAEGLQEDSLSNITSVVLQRSGLQRQDRALLLLHLIPISVANAFHNLQEVELCSVVYSEVLHHNLLTAAQEQQQQQQQMEHACSERLEEGQDKATAAAYAKQQKEAEQLLLCDSSLEAHAYALLQTQQGQAVATSITAPARVPHLLCLKLQSCKLWSSVGAFQQQVQALPDLREFRIVECEFMDEEAEQGYAAAVADTRSAQLVSLQWDSCMFNSSFPDVWVSVVCKAVDFCAQGIAPLFSKPYTQLQTLHMPLTTIEDTLMQLLLQQAPKLKHLQVAGFWLKGDFSHRQCSWETVVMESSVEIGSLVRMPLSSRPTICVALHLVRVWLASTECSTECEELQVVAAAAAAVEQCGGIQPVSRKGSCQPGQILLGAQLKSSVAGYERQRLPAHMDKRVMATLPMLSNAVRHLTLDSLRVTKEFLAAINRHLPHCCEVEFEQGCTFGKGMSGGMLSVLPKVVKLTMCPGTVALQQLVVLCTTATHPITLNVITDGHQFLNPDASKVTGLETVLKQAQISAGHSWVKVVCKEDRSVATFVYKALDEEGDGESDDGGSDDDEDREQDEEEDSDNDEQGLSEDDAQDAGDGDKQGMEVFGQQGVESEQDSVEKYDEDGGREQNVESEDRCE